MRLTNCRIIIIIIIIIIIKATADLTGVSFNEKLYLLVPVASSVPPVMSRHQGLTRRVEFDPETQQMVQVNKQVKCRLYNALRSHLTMAEFMFRLEKRLTLF